MHRYEGEEEDSPKSAEVHANRVGQGSRHPGRKNRRAPAGHEDNDGIRVRLSLDEARGTVKMEV